MARYLTIAAAQDLATDIRREAERNIEQGYYEDGNGLNNLADELDREIADAQENGQDVFVPEDSNLEAAAEHHGFF